MTNKPERSYLGDFCDAAWNLPRLTASEEIDLARRTRDGDMDARSRLIEANMRLVQGVVRRLSRKIPYEDMVSHGYIGLVMAADGFDPDAGFRFSTYAVSFIKGRILCAIRGRSWPIKIPPKMFERDARYKHPELWESSRKVMSLIRCDLCSDIDVQSLSIDPIEFIQDNEYKEILINGVRQAVNKLPPLEAEIVKDYFGIGRDSAMNITEIANRFGTSRQMVHARLTVARERLALTLKDIQAELREVAP